MSEQRVVDGLPDALGGRRYDRVDHETGEFLGFAWMGDPTFVVVGADLEGILDACRVAATRIGRIDRAGREGGTEGDDPSTWLPSGVLGPTVADDRVELHVNLSGEYGQEQVEAMADAIVEELAAAEVDGLITGPSR